MNEAWLDIAEIENRLSTLLDDTTREWLHKSIDSFFGIPWLLLEDRKTHLFSSLWRKEPYQGLKEKELPEIESEKLTDSISQDEDYGCFRSSAGFDYLVFPLTLNFDEIGTLVAGPFNFAEIGETKKSPPPASQARALRAGLPPLSFSQTQAVKVGRFITELLLHLISNNYKRMVTANLHLNTVQISYEELLEKNKKLEASEKRYRDLTAGLEIKVREKAAALNQANLQLMQSEKMASLGQMAGGVAHEINNPIAFVKGNLSAAQEMIEDLSTILQDYMTLSIKVRQSDTDTIIAGLKEITQKAEELDISFIVEDFKNLMNESLDGANRVQKIVKDLKGFVCLDEESEQAVDLNQNLDSALNMLSGRLKDRLTVKKDYGVLPAFLCYSSQINQVFMNILLNAIQAMPQGGTIDIKTATDGKNILVTITDTGCGIPKENLSRIFDPFFTTRNVGEGTGLGLSFAYDIIKNHGGKIRVESETGKGSSFSVILVRDRGQKTENRGQTNI